MAAIPLITAGVGAATAMLNKSSANQQQATQNQLTQAPEAANQAVQAAQTQLAQRKFGSDQAQLALQNALRGGLLKGLTDASITAPAGIAQYMGKSTGGLRPSAISGGQQIGSDLQRQALLDLMQPRSGSGAGAVPRSGPSDMSPSGGPMAAMDQSGGLYNVPMSGLPAGTPGLPQPNGFEKFLNFALPAASLATGVYSALKKPNPGNVGFTLQ
jgi:hypothetical protein